jgi:hypothetical protein
MSAATMTPDLFAYYRLMRVRLRMPHITDDDCAAIDLRLGEVARTLKTGGGEVSMISVARSEARALVRQRIAAGLTHHLCAADAEEGTT